MLIPTAPGRRRVELRLEAVEVGPQLGLGRVLLADLADLAADADRDPVGLELADQGGQLGRPLVVLALLEVDVRLRQVDEGRAVDVDVAVAGGDRLAAGRPDLLGHLLGIGLVLRGVELVVVALDEDRVLPARGDRPGQDARRVFGRALERVGLLAPGELEDHGADAVALGDLEDRPGHVEGLGAQVDRRHGEPVDLAPGAGEIEVLDAGRVGAELEAGLPDQPAGRLDRRIILGEGRCPGEVADRRRAERRLVGDDEPAVADRRCRREQGEEPGDRFSDGGHQDSPLGDGTTIRARLGNPILAGDRSSPRRPRPRRTQNDKQPFGGAREDAADPYACEFVPSHARTVHKSRRSARQRELPNREFGLLSFSVRHRPHSRGRRWPGRCRTTGRQFRRCSVRPRTKSTRTYSPRCSGSA